VTIFLNILDRHKARLISDQKILIKNIQKFQGFSIEFFQGQVLKYFYLNPNNAFVALSEATFFGDSFGCLFFRKSCSAGAFDGTSIFGSS